MSYLVYILKCKDDTLYIGQTNNLEKRLKAHHEGKGAKYTRGRGPFQIVYMEEFLTVNEALRREIALKKLSRQEKLDLISVYDKTKEH